MIEERIDSMDWWTRFWRANEVNGSKPVRRSCCERCVYGSGLHLTDCPRRWESAGGGPSDWNVIDWNKFLSVEGPERDGKLIGGNLYLGSRPL